MVITNNSLHKAYDACRVLYQKIDSVQRSNKRTVNAYNIIRDHINKISDLVDNAFDIKVKKRIQRDLKKVIEDVTAIGYDEL